MYNDGGIDANGNPSGNCTIGVGHLIHLGVCNGDTSEAPYVNGITRDRALELFEADLSPVEGAVKSSVSIRTEQHQFDALASFGFNTGYNGLGAWPNVIAINNENYEEAATIWLSTAVIDVTGNVNAGLQRRRVFEAELFRDGIYRMDW